jgi:hypothetical protein
LRRIRLAPWEVRAIRALSEAFCEVNAVGAGQSPDRS